MKIEMCESLVKSWLKHVKVCNVTELNYKPSSLWETYDEETVSKLFERVKAEFTYMGIEIFKNNSNWSQLIRQAEIDVMGVKLFGNKVEEYYLVEVAFHENGVNYGSKEVTIANILKKLIRGIFILYCKFGSVKGNIIFASPKMNNIDHINEGIKRLYEILDSVIINHDFKISIITNEDFQNEILNKVLINSDTIADTSELFLRSYQLLNLFDKSTVNIPETKDNLNVIKHMTPKSVKKSEYRTRDLISDEALENEHKVAYYLSRFEHDLIFPELSQTEALIKICEILKVKESTLRQKRDRFDPFCNTIKTRGNKRRGYWQYDKLPEDMKYIYDYYLNKSEEDIRDEIKVILKIV